MYYVAITLKIMPCNNEVDVDIPWQMPLPEFLTSKDGLEEIIRSQMPECADRVLYARTKNKTWWKLGRKIQGHFVPLYTHTLRGAGVYDGDYLFVQLYAAERDPYQCYLEVLSDNQQDIERIYLLDDEIIIGRNVFGDKSPIVHVDIGAFSPAIARYISRRHVRIKRDKRGFYIQDLGSQNGTAINGTLLTSERKRPSPSYRINHGDEITLAKRITFKFYDKGTLRFQETEKRNQV